MTPYAKVYKCLVDLAITAFIEPLAIFQTFPNYRFYCASDLDGSRGR